MLSGCKPHTCAPCFHKISTLYNYFIHPHPLYNILKYFYHSVFEHQQPIIVRGPSAALKPTGALALLLISRYLDGQT